MFMFLRGFGGYSILSVAFIFSCLGVFWICTFLCLRGFPLIGLLQW